MFLSFGFRITLSDVFFIGLIVILVIKMLNLKDFENMKDNIKISGNMITIIMCWWTEAILDVVQNYMIKDASPSPMNRLASHALEIR